MAVKAGIKKGVKLMIIILLVMIFAGLAFMTTINIYIKSSVKDRILSPNEASELQADCILILGAGIWENNKPSSMLQDRLLQGIELYELRASTKLLMSGDHGSKDYDEVNVMKDFAIERGVPSENIFMDHAGFSTYESMYRARDVFKVKKIIIVTQGYHLYRALYDAQGLGLEAYGVAADPREYAGQNYREFREAVARVKDFLYVIIKPEPKYLGDEMPITGNGDSTND